MDYDNARHITRAIPSGVTLTDADIGKAAYESASGEGRPNSAITQRPIGVIAQVDATNGQITVCREGPCFAKPGAGVDLSAQLAAHGAKACSLADGRLGTPASTAFSTNSLTTLAGRSTTSPAAI